MAAFVRGYKRPSPRREPAEDLVSSENAQGLIRIRICGLAFEICRILFLKIWNHAILFVRSPMKRTCCGPALPETPLPHVEAAAHERSRPPPEGVCRRSPRPRDRAGTPRSDVSRPWAAS
jgi:hypothetical protein